jgi:hypothetical protein
MGKQFQFQPLGHGQAIGMAFRFAETAGRQPDSVLGLPRRLFRDQAAESHHLAGSTTRAANAMSLRERP